MLAALAIFARHGCDGFAAGEVTSTFAVRCAQALADTLKADDNTKLVRGEGVVDPEVQAPLGKRVAVALRSFASIVPCSHSKAREML